MEYNKYKIVSTEPYGDRSIMVVTHIGKNNFVISIYESNGGDGGVQLNEEQTKKFKILLQEGFELLENNKNKDWSIIDYISCEDLDKEETNFFVALYKENIVLCITFLDSFPKKKSYGIKICLNKEQTNRFISLLSL